MPSCIHFRQKLSGSAITLLYVFRTPERIMREHPTLCVLICSHNRAELLIRTLKYLNTAQRPTGWHINIHVVANACNDNTLDSLDAFNSQNKAHGLPLSWSEQPIAGKSLALNDAIPHMKSDLLAFVDDDHRVDSGYLVSICDAAENYPDAGLFCGRILPDWDGSEPAWVHSTGPYQIRPLPVPRFDQGNESMNLTPDVAIPGGGNLVLRTEWFKQVGPFSTELGPTGHDLEGAEDLDWVLRALRLGAKLQYIPAMIQYHYVDQERLRLPYLMKKAYKRTASTIGLNSKAPGRRIPLFHYRKIIEFPFYALTSVSTDRRRYFLVRTAAALGEIKGLRQRISKNR